MMRFSWFSKSRRVRQTQESPRAARSARTPRLRLEALEDRLLLSASTVALNSISGYVYNDANNNGLKDAGEHGIANNAVNLYDATGALVATTATDANGYYQFSTDPRVSTNPTTQSYTATFTNLPTNWTQQQAIAQFNPALGTLVSVQIQNNDPLTSDIKVENLDTAAQAVNAVVQGTLTLNGPGVNQLTTNLSATQSYNAAAFDGTIDFTGASGHDFGPQTATGSKSITITDPTQLAAYIGTGTVTFSETAQGTSTVTGSANVVAQINTTASSELTVTYTYIPNNGLAPGNYTVTQPNDPAGYLDGQTTAGNVTPLPHSVGTNSIPVTLVSGTPSMNNNFGEVQPSQLAGFVYVDTNDNGVMDSGEAGIANVTVHLAGTDDTGAAINLSTTTAADGSYSFGTLRPGSYSLQEDAPTGYLLGKETLGTQGGTLGDQTFTSIAMNPGTQGANYNFGHLLASNLAGFVYYDANNNGTMDSGETGISGVTVNLTGQDDLGHAVSQSVVTAADGSYSFQNLRPGSYTLQEVGPPQGYLDGQTSAGSQGGAAGHDQIASIALASNTTGTNNDFGAIKSAGLAGNVYMDANNNGTRDAGENGIANVVVHLTGTDDLGNAVSLTATTASDGSYSFTSLRPGTYTIVEVQPTGYLQGKDAAGSLGGDSSQQDRFAGITLQNGGAGTEYDFGELAPGSLGGFVYVDKNHSGVRQAGDPGIAGVLITLTGMDDLGHAVQLSQRTLADGSYNFTNLRPGTYTIQETQPAGYLQGQNTIGTPGGSLGTDAFTNIQLAVGFGGLNNNFGEVPPPPPPPVVPPLVPPPVPPPPPLSKQLLIFFFG